MFIRAPEDAAAGRSHWERYEFVLCPEHAPNLTVTTGTAALIAPPT